MFWGVLAVSDESSLNVHTSWLFCPEVETLSRGYFVCLVLLAWGGMCLVDSQIQITQYRRQRLSATVLSLVILRTVHMADISAALKL